MRINKKYSVHSNFRFLCPNCETFSSGKLVETRYDCLVTRTYLPIFVTGKTETSLRSYLGYSKAIGLNLQIGAIYINTVRVVEENQHYDI